MYDFTEPKFQEALQLACSFFPIDNLRQKLHDDQEQVLRKFFFGYDIFLSAHTGFGKSLIFQMSPIIADFFLDRLPGMSTVVVVSPLKALMKDQAKYLNDKTGIPAIALIDMADQQQDEAVTEIEDGVYGIVYSSPETFLSMKRWRKLASSSSFRNNCVALVVDEAHCLVQW